MYIHTDTGELCCLAGQLLLWYSFQCPMHLAEFEASFDLITVAISLFEMSFTMLEWSEHTVGIVL